MAQPHDDHTGAAPALVLDQRLRGYLPPDMFEDLAAGLDDADALAGRVGQAFVHLAAARYTIATYLPGLLVRQLLRDRLESPWLRPVEGSLLFADLSGSTALAERLSTLGREGIELVTAFLNHIFETMIQVVRDYGGDLVSFGGGALLVFFGDERHPRTAARAAVALQDALHGYVRAVPGIGDEYEIVLSTRDDGLDVMIVRVEHAGHAAPGAIVEQVGAELRSRCELRAGVEVLAPNTLPKTEFKAKRVRDNRKK